MTQKCSNCKYYSNDADQVKTFGGALDGVCRIHRPIVVPTISTQHKAVAQFPQCTNDTWCGEWAAIV